ncbi:MAG: RND family efflux transporter MFP subunit [Paracoccaceae bacterium]|jgi:RND family efflux transporter MFP subunit
MLAGVQPKMSDVLHGAPVIAYLRGGHPRLPSGRVSRRTQIRTRTQTRSAAMTRLPALALALAAAIAAATCPARADIALPVELIVVRDAAVSFDMALTGAAQPSNSYAASFPTGGRVISVAVQSGDLVRAGDELARTDPAQQTQALRAAEAGLRAAEAGLTRATQDFDRQKTLLDRGAVTRTDFDAAREDLQSAEAARDQVATEVGKTKKALADTILTAPRDALVTRRNVEAGEVVGPAQAIIDLAHPTERDAVFLAPDDIPADGIMGAELTLRLLERKSLPLTAKITEISPLVDPRTGSITVRARIENPPAGVALLGEPIEGSLTVTLPHAVRLPWTALTAAPEGMAVWTVAPGAMTVSLTPVDIARFGTDAVFVSGGLAPGAVVVGAGSQLLYPGRVVRDAAAAPVSK